MIAMQYKISLPDNYDMNVIRQRVADNGHRTDGFQDLIFKAYLISEKRDSSKSCNEYSPLYIWQNNDGMNKFIFDGWNWFHIDMSCGHNCFLYNHSFTTKRYFNKNGIGGILL